MRASAPKRVCVQCSADRVPLMITFPSVKDRTWAAKHPGYSTAQLLVLVWYGPLWQSSYRRYRRCGQADWSWFSKHWRGPSWARHAPPHLQRADAAEYALSKGLGLRV
jgi:hypothetical protein